MLSDDQKQRVGQKLRLFQLVPLCTILFVVGFALFVSQISGKAIETGPPKMLTMFGLFAALAMFTMSCFVPQAFSGIARVSNSQDVNAAVNAGFSMFAVETMIRYALILAATFANLLLFIVEPHVASLAVAGLGALLMIFFFPRKSKAISLIGARIKSS